MRYLIWFLSAVFLCGCATAPPAENGEFNPRLMAMFKEDQGARGKKWEEIDWTKVNAQDKTHREEVLSLLKTGQVRSQIDYCNAALIYQHGDSADDIRLAYSLAWLCASLTPEVKQIRSLSAAAWDRIMMQENKPQWYGTQYTKTKANGPWELYNIDESAVTDTERERMGVPSLSEAKAHVLEMNK